MDTKNVGNRLLLGLVALGMLGGFCSCEEEEYEPLNYSKTVAFTATIDSTWTDGTTRAGNTALPKDTSIQLRGGESPIYLNTYYTDGINLSKDKANGKTKAAPITTETMYDNIKVSGYKYVDGTWSTLETAMPNFFKNVTARKSGSKYIMDEQYFWPGANYKVKFVGVGPWIEGKNIYELEEWAGKGWCVGLDLKDKDVADLKDVVVMESEEINGNYEAVCPVKFKHICTAVRFKCDEDMVDCTIKKITLKNVNYSMDYLGESKDVYLEKYYYGNFEVNMDKKISGGTGLINEADTTFMMVPQTVPGGATIEIVFNDGEYDDTVTASIGGQEWKMGTTVTYVISHEKISWVYQYGPTASSGTYQKFTPKGYADDNYSSGMVVNRYRYRSNNSNNKDSLSVKFQFKEGNATTWSDECPEWFKMYEYKEGDIEKYVVVECEDRFGDFRKNTEASKAVIKRSVVGNENSRVNLSSATVGGTDYNVYNTANCYVVNSAGYYMLPLVYGNAIKNGKINSGAYKNSNTLNKAGWGCLNTFMSGGGTIDDAYISSLEALSMTAKVVWQDAKDLVTNVSVVVMNGIGWLKFDIKKENVREGNAVIGVMNSSGNIVWSWHIWVTDNATGKCNTVNFTNGNNKTYTAVDRNLGWVEGGSATIEKRICKVRMICDSLNLTSEEWTIEQRGMEVNMDGYSPYYQWGRKDPIPATLAKTTTTYDWVGTCKESWYDGDGNAYTEPQYKEMTTLESMIQNPMYFNSATSVDYKFPLYRDYWNASTKVYVDMGTTGVEEKLDGTVTKTVYDPCPVGFCVPGGGVLISPNGGGTAETSLRININKAGGSEVYLENRGKYICTTTSGVYIEQGDPVGDHWGASTGLYWEADLGAYRGFCTQIRSDGNYFCGNATVEFGCQVRPVTE